MNFSRFFITRPVFASVLSLLILVAGLLALPVLPVSEYPNVVPPQVVVRATYPGANPAVIAETVAAPIEEAVNGVENLLYMSSHATSNGRLTLTISFKLGTDPDLAQQQVQNRVTQAEARLPAEVRALGITVHKNQSALPMLVHVTSPNGKYDLTYLRNYALLHVRDRLQAIPGVGPLQMFGGGEYAMRVWLDPDKVAARGLSASDINAAIRAENVQAVAGVIGAPPAPAGQALQLSVNAQGRLATEEDFRQIILKTAPGGAVTRLGDVARIELGAAEYALRSRLNNQQAVGIPISMMAGANALQVSRDVREAMQELKAAMPDGVSYDIAYDTSEYVQESIDAVIVTLLEALALVVIVVIVFLRSWRASLIALLAVPVSIVGTFAVMYVCGFTINALTLFGLVLAIGIVVDDAIVVVENVQRNIEAGMAPRDATVKAMDEVAGPIVAIALVLGAVFIPLAFVSGLSGQFYRQFALTIAISTAISAINSLTLSPALSALLLRPHAKRSTAGWFSRSTERYARGVQRIAPRKWLGLGLYAALLAGGAWLFDAVPGGYLPQQDKGYLLGMVRLPEGASLERTDEVTRRVVDIAKQTPSVRHAITLPGLSINGFTVSSSQAVVFLPLNAFGTRPHSNAIAQQLNKQFGAIAEAQAVVFPPPALLGLGAIGGFKLQLEDRAGLGFAALDKATKDFIVAAGKAPELAGLLTNFNINTPQLHADIDRTLARQLGVPLNEVFATLQVYLGSQYVNDISFLGRTFGVRVQADAAYRATPEDIGKLKVRSTSGAMVPLSSLLQVRETAGPITVSRYNTYVTADINGRPAPGYTSGQAQEAIARVAAESLPPGIAWEWTDLTYQQQLAGNTAVYVFPLVMLLVFLLLAAQYESLVLPLAVLLTVPAGLMAALFSVWITGADNNVFTQIGLFILVGLSAKNAILIVEFARELERLGLTPLAAAVQASQQRLRPILMTSIAFVMGVLPLVLSSGAGAEMRKAIGVAVFGGMIGATLLGLLFTPFFYVLLRSIPRPFR